jgi:hypothetical protein
MSQRPGKQLLDQIAKEQERFEAAKKAQAARRKQQGGGRDE